MRWPSVAEEKHLVPQRKVTARFPLLRSQSFRVESEEPVKHFLVSKKPTVLTESECEVKEYLTLPPLMDQRCAVLLLLPTRR